MPLRQTTGFAESLLRLIGLGGVDRRGLPESDLLSASCDLAHRFVGFMEPAFRLSAGASWPIDLISPRFSTRLAGPTRRVVGLRGKLGNAPAALAIVDDEATDDIGK